MNNVEIKELRDSMGLSQKVFGDKVGVTYVTICRWERGKTEPLPVYLPILEKLKAKAVKKAV